MGPPSSSSSSNANPSRKMRNLVGIFKDKVSLIKATLLLSKRTSSSFHVAVLRATSHFPADPPPETTVEDVLAIGHHHRSAASSVVESLLRRLRRTQNAYVALKCLLTLHHILSRGSPVFRNQISATVGPHNNLLNLSNFRDESDADSWELSAWIRWYAGVLEQEVIAGNTLGFSFLSPLTGQRREREGIPALREMGALVGMVEEISRAPESLHFQRIALIHEVMKLVGEDYRMTMRHILGRIAEFGRRIDDLSDEELNDIWTHLKKLEGCKEKVVLMFLNKKNDGGWDLIEGTRKEVEVVKQRRESSRLVSFSGSGSARLGGDAARGGEVKPLGTRGRRWLDVAWNPLVAVPQAC